MTSLSAEAREELVGALGVSLELISRRLAWRQWPPVCMLSAMSGARAKVFRTGGGQAVQLPQELGFPDGQTEVLVRREGNRLVLEPIAEDWPEEFRACLGAWAEEIERPTPSPLHELRDRLD